MRFRRLVLWAAPAAALLMAAGASAAPTITPQTLQCDGTFANGGNTHHPAPTVQALVQDASGLRIGQAGMGITGGTIRALWRFDVSQDVADSCAADAVTCPTSGFCRTESYSYSDPNNSDSMATGSCVYDAACGAGATNNGLVGGTAPLGLGACPSPATLPLPTTQAFGAGQFGTAATFDGSTQSGSVAYNRTGLGDRGASYTLSAWINPSTVSGTQPILAERGAAGFWGFGLSGSGLVLFDSRDTSAAPAQGSAVTAGAWHKVDVVRLNGSQERFYVDGNRVGAVAVNSTDTFVNHPISQPVLIGHDNGNFFGGSIDELRVLDTALSDEEIFLEYNGSNLHKYTGGGTASPYGVVFGGLPGSNGVTSQEIYPMPPAENVTPASAPNQRWTFEAQNTGSVSTILSTFTVTIDQTGPTAPQFFTGTPNGTAAVTWSWTAPSHYCQPPGSGSVFYQLFDAVNGGAALNPPGNMAYPATSVSESGTANELLSRRLTVTDTWGTSPLTASASAYTMAAVPSGLAATNVSTGSFVATWNANGNPSYTRYEVTYTGDPNFIVGVTTRVALTDNFTGTSVGIAGLTSGSTYYVRVYSFNGRSTDTFGGVRSATFASMDVVAVPPAPALAGTANSTSQITWAWTAASGATGYTLYDSPTQAVLFGPNGDALTFARSGLAVNTRYDAEVEAVLPAGEPASGRGHAFAYTQADPPSGESVYAVYETSAVFAWNPNGNPAGTFYQIIVSTDQTFGVVTSTLTVSTPTAVAAGLLPGVTYYAHVEAISGGQIETGYGVRLTAVTVGDPAITVNSAPASPYVAPSGLVGAWQFDENTGTTTADSSGGGNTGNLGCSAASTCVSTPTFSAGPFGFGSAVSFSGLAGGRVLTNTGAPFNFPGSVTVEAWVNPLRSQQIAGAGIVAVGTMTKVDFALDFTAAGSVEFLTSNAGVELPVASPAALAPGQWTHVVGVYDSAHSTSTLYINGLAVATRTSVPARANLHPQLAIGNRQDASGSFTLPFAGSVDSVRVIASALTAQQVQSDYAGGFISSVTPGGVNAGIIVALPPNAFGAPAQIYVTNDPVNHPIRITSAQLSAGLSAPPSGLTLVPNSLVEVVPVVGGLPFTTPLGSSATLTIPYKDPNNTGLISGTNPPLAAAGLQMYTLNTAVNAWTLLPTTVDKASKSASAQTPHFSLFGLFAPATVGTSLAGVKAFPVPWKPGSGTRFDAAGVTFANLPAAGTIRILTLAGRKVRDLPFNGVSAGSAVWDGANDDGRRAASGVYFARVTSAADGSTILVKFAVER